MVESLLTSADIADIRGEVYSLINDESIGSITISYRMTGTTVSSYSPTTAIIPDLWTPSSVSGWKGSYSLDEVQKSSLLEMGDVKFIVMLSSVTGVLSVDDRIFESGSSYQSATTYEIKTIGKDPLNIAYFLQCRSI